MSSLTSRTFTTLAIILNRRQFQENDRIISMYTQEHGKIVAVAVGSSKISSKLAAHLEPMCVSEVFIANGRKRDKIAGAVLEERFPNILKDDDRLRLASACLLLVDKQIKEGVRDERIFQSLLEVLRQMNVPEVSARDLEKKVFYFARELLHFLGFEKKLEKCLHCGRLLKDGEQVVFFYEEHGLLCHGCVLQKGNTDRYQYSACLTFIPCFDYNRNEGTFHH